MQCTGVKDKNGKLIYEGDIVVIPVIFYDPSEVDSPNCLGIVEWSCYGRYVLEDRLYEYIEDSVLDGEVIGNIYENPELLK